MKKLLLVIMSVILSFLIFSCKAEDEPSGTKVSGHFIADFAGSSDNNEVTVKIYNDSSCSGTILKEVKFKNGWSTTKDVASVTHYMAYELTDVEDGTYYIQGHLQNSLNVRTSTITTCTPLTVNGDTTKDLNFNESEEV